MEELWRAVDGYEGRYEVSNLGRVRSLNYNHTNSVREIKQFLSTHGYLRILLHKDGKRKNVEVHRLVVEAFLGKIPDGMCVDHLDGNKTNNAVGNLEVVTPRENTIRAYKHGLRKGMCGKMHPMYGRMGVNNPQSMPVYQCNISGDIILRHPGISEASRKLGIDASSISKCCKGKYTTAGGYVWKYAKEVNKDDQLSQAF